MRITCQDQPRAFMLVDCIIYCLIFFVILGLAFAAFYETVEHSKRLSRSADDIARILKAGERWRSDIRAASSNPRFLEPAPEPTLIIPQGRGEVAYVFRQGTIFRRADSGSPWLEFLPGVENSLMQRDQRKKVLSWRWEVELKANRKKVYTKPLFTFQAVANEAPKL